MDPITAVTIGFGVVKAAMGLVDQAKAAGLLGGVAEWVPIAQDLSRIAGNFATFVAESTSGAFDAAMTEDDIRRRLHPDSWAAAEARIKAELGNV